LHNVYMKRNTVGLMEIASQRVSVHKRKFILWRNYCIFWEHYVANQRFTTCFFLNILF